MLNPAQQDGNSPSNRARPRVGAWQDLDGDAGRELDSAFASCRLDGEGDQLAPGVLDLHRRPCAPAL